MLIVPNTLTDAINAKLDRALKECPEAEKDREELFRQILSHFNEHGVIPDFVIGKRE